MWADDDDFGIRDGILVLSKNPSLKVEQLRLVIRDGRDPRTGSEHVLALTRAEARSGLRHIVMVDDHGGFITLAATRWLNDTRVALSQIDGRGDVAFAFGPRGPDRPWLRRAQAIVGSGIMPAAAAAIARELLRAKLLGQSEVAGLMGFPEASAEIARYAGAIESEPDGAKMLWSEAVAGQVYWRCWQNMSVSFARVRAGGFTSRGTWKDSLPVPDHWLVFGSRSSLLTGKPWRATNPANACLNFCYGLLKAEMEIALLGASLDPGCGLFHLDRDGRSSLALDALEPIRPFADAWLASFLAQSSFLLRDFTEWRAGEVRLSHPLRQHLARSAALFRPACERVASWLARAFETGRIERMGVAGDDDRALIVSATLPASPHVPALPKLLPAFLGPREARHHKLPRLKDAPRSCAECGKALRGRGKFCSRDCSQTYSLATRNLMKLFVVLSEETMQRRIEKSRASYEARRRWGAVKDETGQLQPAQISPDAARWYTDSLQPRLTSLRPADIARALSVSSAYAAQIRHGRRPHPRHWMPLAQLAQVNVPEALIGAG